MNTGPGDPLDDIDAAILAQVRALHAELDPPPPSLTEQVCFALELEDIDADVARLREETLIGSGARGPARTRTLTFEAAGLSLLLSIAELGDQQVRLDGWLAPPVPGPVELRQAAAAAGRRAVIRQATPDAGGRFVFEDLRHGLVQIRIRPGGDRAGRSVITPAIRL